MTQSNAAKRSRKLSRQNKKESRRGFFAKQVRQRNEDDRQIVCSVISCRPTLSYDELTFPIPTIAPPSNNLFKSVDFEIVIKVAFHKKKLIN